MKKSMKSIIVLVSICAVMALLLALTNSITAPIIKENQNAAANEALLEVMPDGKDFKKMDLSAYKLPATVEEAYSEAGGGYVVKLLTAGYGSDFSIMCGITADGTVSGVVCLSSNETLGFEKTYGASLVGKKADDIDAVATVSGATKTTAAYRAAVKDALTAAMIFGGASVDVRTEEEILAENLGAALPAANGAFEKLFICEVIDGVDAVYKATNGKGFVYVIGEEFIAVDESGATANEAAATAHAILTATTLTELDLSLFEALPDALSLAKKTATGNYVLELKAYGYAMTGDHFYGDSQPIVIRVSMTAEGKIIDTLTVSQTESQGYGADCSKESFYGQFDGKTEADYTQIDAISGATVTTNAYLKAIERAFETVKILEGGATE